MAPVAEKIVPNESSARKTGDPLALPPGVSSEEFESYVKEAIEIVGPENVSVITDKEDLNKDKYQDPAKEHDMYHVFDKVKALLCPIFQISCYVISNLHILTCVGLLRCLCCHLSSQSHRSPGTHATIQQIWRPSLALFNRS